MTLMLFNYENSFKLKRKAIGGILVNSYDRLARKEQLLLEKGKISEFQYQDFVWKLGQRLEFSYELISAKCKRFYVDPPLKKKWEIN
jgi:hypothetical protein